MPAGPACWRSAVARSATSASGPRWPSIWWSGSTSGSSSRGRGARAATARSRASAPQFEHLYHLREPIYAELADVIVPAERSHRMGPILAARDDVPDGTKLLWAATAGNPGADYPVYVGNGLLTEHRLLAADGDRPAVPRHRRRRRQAVRRPSRAAQREGGDHARRAVEDRRARRDRVDRARAGRDDAPGRGRRARGRRGRGPRRVLRRHLPARRSLRAGADDARGPGRLRLRGQDRGRPRRGQELRRRVPPALGRDHRHRDARNAPASRAGGRLRRGGQDRADRRRRAVGARPPERGSDRPGPDRRVRAGQAPDRRPRRARRRHPAGPEPRPHGRARDRDRDRATRPIATARRSRSDCWRRSASPSSQSSATRSRTSCKRTGSQPASSTRIPTRS